MIKVTHSALDEIALWPFDDEQLTQLRQATFLMSEEEERELVSELMVVRLGVAQFAAELDGRPRDKKEVWE